MLAQMTTANVWTLRSWKDAIEKQLNSWMMYIPGLSSGADVQKVKSFKGLLFLIASNHFNFDSCKNLFYRTIG